MNTVPTATLDHAGIAARVPHSGSMCLLHAVLAWSADDIHCTAHSHSDLNNPLRGTTGLLSACAIEYAAQAMAVHAALCGERSAADAGTTAGATPSPGFLASARAVRLWVARLDMSPGPLHVQARLLAGDGRQAQYRFELHDAEQRPLAEGRVTVVLNTALTVATT